MLKNHLIQIPTGEGKSVVLGVTSIILAKLQFEIYCVCYRSYLSQRDYDEFLPLFQAFSVENAV